MCCLLMCCSSLLPATAGDPPHTALRLSVRHLVDGKPLVRRDSVYTNASGETFTITRFRYYLSNFSLLTTDGKELRLPPNYFLVDDSIPSSKEIVLNNIPAGNYSGIRFLIGVDSIRNASGVQAGVLAPENGLFWTWNSGYIMAQLEGVSPAVKAPSHQFLFHIGGYRKPYSVLQPLTLSFPKPLVVAAGKESQIKVVADAGKWFHAAGNVSFQDVAVIMAPGPNALKIAANYFHMFEVEEIVR
ncbi:MAG TPA: MbnP family protein [Chitinophaga sp.]|uniref:MbnP family protein n=1 Tax=Chitinophaga sp. TaxID=1869181 RepID=UPI002B94A6F3|nr:MbnP family protein [Chitinophaga sp.]HVI45960.1 MbnP family protein [Chitinophaga sp.]